MYTLDIDGAAEMLKASPETIRELAATGRIPAVKIGRAWLFVIEDLIVWLREQSRLQRNTHDAAAALAPRKQRRRRAIPTLP